MFTVLDMLTNGIMTFLIVSLMLIRPTWLPYVLAVSVAAGVCGLITIVFSLLAFGSPKWFYVLWGLVLICTGFFKIWRSNQLQPTYQFNDEEMSLYMTFFTTLTVSDFGALIEHAVWRDMQPDETLVRKGERVTRLSLVVRGLAKAQLSEANHVDIKPGQFIGEMSFISGNTASVTVTIAEPTLLVEWPQQTLRVLISQNPIIGSCIQSHFNRDLHLKLNPNSTVSVNNQHSEKLVKKTTTLKLSRLKKS